MHGFIATFALLFLAITSTALSLPKRQFSGILSGDGTFFSVGLGACGITNVDSDRIVAVSASLFNSFPGATANPNANPVCGKTITASSGGKSTTVTVTDRCTGCAAADLDFSPAAFQDLADESLGRIPITWSFNN